MLVRYRTIPHLREGLGWPGKALLKPFLTDGEILRHRRHRPFYLLFQPLHFSLAIADVVLKEQ
jgi:hypothetical protein